MYSATMAYFTPVNEFITWLDGELNARNWTRAELARRAKITQGSLSHIASGRRNPGPELCEGIARALNLPRELVYRKAGLLPAVAPRLASAQAPARVVEPIDLDALPERVAAMLAAETPQEIARIVRTFVERVEFAGDKAHPDGVTIRVILQGGVVLGN